MFAQFYLAIQKFRKINDIIIVCLFSECLQTHEPDLADDQSIEGNYNILML